MQAKKDVLILGFGEMGHAMKTLLQPFHNVMIWNRSSVAGHYFDALESLIPEADVIILCIPTQAYQDLILKIRPLLNDDTLIIGLAKGLNDQGLTATEILKKELKHYALLYGPMIAEELIRGNAGFADVGYHLNADKDLIQTLFANTMLYLHFSEDIAGIGWSAVLKNVYALAFGMIDELDLGKNVRGFFITMAVNEINTIARLFGAYKTSSYGFAGLGDLETTASSEDSRHHTLGRRIARCDFSNMYAEGIHTLSMIEKFQRFNAVNYPLFHTIKMIVSNETGAKEGLEKLFTTASL